MKTEFLKELGLEQEAIDKIMAENGKDVNAEKVKATAKDGEIATANASIKSLQDTVKKFDGVDVDKLKADLATAQTKYDTELEKTKLDSALEVALLQGKAKNSKAVKALLDYSEIKLDGDKLLGLDKQLEAIKKESGYLFDGETNTDKKEPATIVKVDSGGEHKGSEGTEVDTLKGALEDYYKVKE